MWKKLSCILLCCMMLTDWCNVQLQADEIVEWYGDADIYNGGIYDMYASVHEGAERASYQWQVDVSMGEGSWYDLEDGNGEFGYWGTKTDHFQLITQAEHEGYTFGTGWEKILFRCKVTLDGQEYYTRPANMIIYPHSEGMGHVDRLDFGINTMMWDGVYSRSEVDGVLYGKAYAGEELYFWVGCKQPEYGEILWRSEVSFVPEVWITENGKTYHSDSGCYYTPHMVGKDALIVEYRVRMFMGNKDMGIYDSQKLVITTESKGSIYNGVAKQDVSVLKDMYTQSEKLTSISKGSTVPIIEQIGGTWYKVRYNNFVGYVPTSALEISNMITNVSATVQEPKAGMTPSLTATLHGAGYDLYDTDPVMWEDKTTGRFMNATDCFIEGHEYRVVFWLKAKNGYEFDVFDGSTVWVEGTVNGNTANVVKAYEQDPYEVIEMWYDFGELVTPHVCTPQLVKRVEPTCETPGFEAYYRCACGMCYQDAQGTNPVNTSFWGKIPATGHNAGEWKYNGTHHYRKCTECLKIIPGTTAAHSGGTATCQQKASCAVCGMQYGNYSDHKWTSSYDYQEQNGHAHSCENSPCTAHDTLKAHTPGPAASEKDPQKCLDCGYILAPAKGHTHQLTKVSKKDADCMNPGNNEYYTCSGCSEWFKDNAGKTKISDKNSVVTAPLGHKVSDWKMDEDYHWMSCTTCNIVMEETRKEHEDGNKDQKCDTCGYDLIVAVGEESSKEESSKEESSKEESSKEESSKIQEESSKKESEVSSEGSKKEPTVSNEGSKKEPANSEPVSREESVNEQDAQDGQSVGVWRWLLPIGAIVIFFGVGLGTSVLILKKKRMEN